MTRKEELFNYAKSANHLNIREIVDNIDQFDDVILTDEEEDELDEILEVYREW